MNYEAHPAIIALFEDHGRVVEAYSMDLFSISRQAALNTELRWSIQNFNSVGSIRIG